MPKIFWILGALVTALTGCATDSAWLRSVDQSVAAGRCNEARNLVQANAWKKELLYAVTGYVYLACEKDLNAAKSYLNLAARLGNTWARQTLAERGLPVPAPDLQAAESGANDGLAAALGGYAAGRYGTPGPAVAPSTFPSISTCDTRRTTMGANVGMDQRYSVTCY